MFTPNKLLKTAKKRHEKEVLSSEQCKDLDCSKDHFGWNLNFETKFYPTIQTVKVKCNICEKEWYIFPADWYRKASPEYKANFTSLAADKPIYEAEAVRLIPGTTCAKSDYPTIVSTCGLIYGKTDKYLFEVESGRNVVTITTGDSSVKIDLDAFIHILKHRKYI